MSGDSSWLNDSLNGRIGRTNDGTSASARGKEKIDAWGEINGVFCCFLGIYVTSSQILSDNIRSRAGASVTKWFDIHFMCCEPARRSACPGFLFPKLWRTSWYILSFIAISFLFVGFKLFSAFNPYLQCAQSYHCRQRFRFVMFNLLSSVHSMLHDRLVTHLIILVDDCSDYLICTCTPHCTPDCWCWLFRCGGSEGEINPQSFIRCSWCRLLGICNPLLLISACKHMFNFFFRISRHWPMSLSKKLWGGIYQKRWDSRRSYGLIGVWRESWGKCSVLLCNAILSLMFRVSDQNFFEANVIGILFLNNFLFSLIVVPRNGSQVVWRRGCKL